MLTREEFVQLYEKYQAGQCTPDEIVLLNNYRDEMHLLDDEFDMAADEKQQMKNRIWQRLEESRSLQPVASKSYTWLKVAAVLLVFLSAGIAFIKYQQKDAAPFIAASEQASQPHIAPGGNKAFLTMANGKTIVLTDAKNGQLGTQAGMRVSKTKDGLLVYSAATATTGTATDANAMNTVSTPRGGQYQVILADGTKVWLNSVSSLKYPVSFDGNTRTVELAGEGYFEVAKNKNKPFIVKANGNSIEVLGTHFDISAYSDDRTVTTTLLEGSVRLRKGDATAMLIPGQQGISVSGSEGFNVQEANTEQAIAWKNGLFMFSNADIRTIMKQASRWYDVDVEYLDNLKGKEFGGKISRYKDISELMHNLELTGTIHFKVEGRRVIVMQ
ncbi:FecR family protein [Mucilaginibacter conchicola]|nr:FecR family protein [Mucilaginibacter conchicola]